MESLEVDLEALKEDNKGTKEMLQQLTQQLATLMTRLPHGPPSEQSQRQPEQHPLQNPEQRRVNYKPNRRTELPNFTGDNLDGWLRWAERYFEDWAPPEHDSQEECTLFTAHVSLNSVMRLTQDGTMKLHGELSLPISEFHSYGIVMSNGHIVQGHGICHNISLKIQDLLIIQDFLRLDLKATLSFSSVSSTALSFSFSLEQSEIAGRLQKRFPQVFEALSRLPPRRTVDHAINLLPCTQPINLQRLVHELCIAGIIQPSFASPILLVKNKDGSWRFCIDYEALNKSTVPNRFPIPIVDELLEELHGMFVFSKLDLKSGYYQIRMKQENIQKTDFKTREGHYEFKVIITRILRTNWLLSPVVKCYATLSWPLTRLLKKNSFHWDSNAQEAMVAPMCIAEGVDVTTINKEVEDDSRLSKIKISLIEGSTSFPHYSIQQGSLLYKGLLQPLPIPNMIWEDLSMDFIEGLPKSKGYDSILVIVDRLNKFGHFIPFRHPFTAKDVAQIFAKEVVKLHGIPRSTVTDRGTIFTSAFWQSLNKLQGTELKMSSSYHPQTAGQTNCNTSHHSAIKMTPFKAVYGRDPPTLTRYGSPMSPIDAIDTYLQERDDTLQLLKEHLLAAQSKMKKANEKLSPRYFGPYPIQEHIGQVTPEDILVIRNSSFDTEVLVKWADLPDFEQFPNFHLQDKVKHMGGNIDNAPCTYARRKKAQSPISQ
ncbi:unnamed protein product [Spirodela intermedia]|uniref:Integrase catalytic domain-containing protein n=1 Tax=Spirodela intermedia TaxID=51605 RepID=A0A7I8IF15_SPIIN|nr:unnamed protein product [Spirodela intermedia]CAA6655693.1 unnamed protein product [Spirodela intermedia]